MRLLAEIHGYPPHHNAGAEWMAHHVFRHFVRNGCQVVILLSFDSYLGTVKEAYTIEGVKVINDKNYEYYYGWADAVFTHLDKTGRAYNRARKYGKPLFHFIHNSHKNVVCETMNGVAQYAIYNTQWVKDAVKHDCIKKSIVVHPPVYIEDYKTERINNYITLINLNKNKGGDFLMELAKAMPGKRFMGVMGSYGDQHFDHKIKNVHYVDNMDILRIYKRTRILLMPSIYESYGRTAIEAACSGIPVICAGTPGLKEAMSNAAIYCDRENIDEWIQAILMLDDEDIYNQASKRCYDRAVSLNPDRELNNLLKFIKDESNCHKNTC